jgi:EAL domain-containing protein (putative c-di-GMP-specific phosphodiesterase class I)
LTVDDLLRKTELYFTTTLLPAHAWWTAQQNTETTMRSRWLSSLTLIKPCWICLIIPPSANTAQISEEMQALGLEPLSDGEHCYTMRTDDNWSLPWRNIYASMNRFRLTQNSQVSILGGEDRPSLQEAVLHQKNVEDIQEISEHMWLLDAIEQNRLSCHFQPVIDRKGEVFGYESLVRATREDGRVASGGAIFQASKLLRIEHLIDRHLHELAIKCYSELGLTGFLFINLIPGFIQRPEFYFGGLSDAARHHNVNPKHIVLDCTNSENPRDIQHLKAITQYCRSQGYLVSLDDIESEHTARRILKEMRPDFIKLDMRLVRRAADADAMDTINELVYMTRNSACSLIAEGVETEDIHKLLQQAGISLFQGYLFSPPESENAPKGECPAPAKPVARRNKA